MKPTVRLGAVQWLAAWAVVLHAVLARFAPDAGLAAWAVVFAVCGALLGTSPLALPGRKHAETALGGASLLALGLGLEGLSRLVGPSAGIWWSPWIALAVLLLADRSVWPRLGRLVSVEWLKMRRSRLFVAGLLGCALVTLLAGLGHEQLAEDTGWSVACASLATGQFVAGVFLLVLGAIALAGEATGGTLKMLLPHAYRRSDWILAKMLVLLLVAVCFTVVVAGVALGHAALVDDFGDVVREGEAMFDGSRGPSEVVHTADVMRGHLRDTLVSGLVALAATALLGLFVSALFDGVVAALCVAFLLFAGIEFADIVLSLPRETLQDLYAWYPAEIRTLTGKLGRVLNERMDAALFPAGLRLAVLTGSAALLLAIRVFSRRDLQV